MQAQVALVTGAAGGLGRAIIAELVARGVEIVAWDRVLPDSDDTISSKVEVRVVDLCDRCELSQAAAELITRRGAPAILINNAGIQGATRPIEEQSDADWDCVLDINLTAAFLMCRAFAPAMRETGYGRIVNIASVAGLRGIENGCAYGASKAGLIGLSQSLAKELITSGVTVNCIAPALTETPLLGQMSGSLIEAASARIPMGRLGRPEEVARMVAWVTSRECSFTTGAVFDVAGGRLGI